MMGPMAQSTIFVRVLLAVVVIAALTGLALYFEGFKAVSAQSSSDRIVATVAGRPIMQRQVESAVSLPLYLLDNQRHQLLLQGIQREIDEELLRAEAAWKGFTIQE